MRTMLIVLLMIACLVAMPTLARACTSFAVYGGEGPIYGMNFDFGKDDIAIRIDEPEGQNRVLSLYLQISFADSFNACLSETGLFTALQDLYPAETSTNPLCYRDTITVSGVAMSVPFLLRDTAQAKALLDTQHIVHAYGSFHVLMADPKDALVLELLTDAPRVTERQGDYLLMTNFAVTRLQNEEVRQMDAIGADRYMLAQDHIEACLPAFSVEDAMDTLALAAQRGGSYPTQFSVVHDANSLTSYLAIGGDYDHIYRIAMMDGTVETYKGFDTHTQWTVDAEDGLPLATLLEAIPQ